METISEEIVERVWREVAGMDPDEGNREMIALSKSQPEILAFMVHTTDDIDPDVAEFAVYAAFVICKMFQHESNSLPKVTADELVEFHKRNTALMESVVGVRGGFAGAARTIPVPAQPHVMSYAVDAILDAPYGEDPVMLSDEDAFYLFFLFKTIAEALDAKG